MVSTDLQNVELEVLLPVHHEAESSECTLDEVYQVISRVGNMRFTTSEAVCKGSRDPLRERLDKIYIVFAQRPCQAISNHFTHSLSEDESSDGTPQVLEDLITRYLMKLRSACRPLARGTKCRL